MLQSIKPILDFEKSSEVQKYKPTDVIQKQSTDPSILFIAGDLLSLSTVESHHFKKFVSTLNPRFQISPRKQLSTKLIDKKYQMIHYLLKTDLQLAQYVCLTTDIWSNRTMKGYFGVTAHYINKWEMKSHMIDCKRIIGRHIGDNIRHEFEEIISASNLSNRITYVISDNASNMVKEFSFPLPGFKDSTIVDGDDDDDNNDDDDELFSGENEDLKVEDLFPKHMQCYAHTLQLVVWDGLDDFNQNMKRIISKAIKITASLLDPRFKVARCDEEKIDLYVDGLKQKVHSRQIDEKVIYFQMQEL